MFKNELGNISFWGTKSSLHVWLLMKGERERERERERVFPLWCELKQHRLEIQGLDSGSPTVRRDNLPKHLVADELKDLADDETCTRKQNRLALIGR